MTAADKGITRMKRVLPALAATAAFIAPTLAQARQVTFETTLKAYGRNKRKFRNLFNFSLDHSVGAPKGLRKQHVFSHQILVI